MNAGQTYTLSRGGEKYGPYTLDQLRDYVKQGSVQMSDLVWSPGMTAWTPVSAVLGSTADPGASPAQVVPPPIPGLPYATPQTPSVYAGSAATALPKPPALHWALVLLLSICTCGLFGYVWMFLQGAWIKRLAPTNNAVVILAVAIPVQWLLYIVSMVSFEDGDSMRTLAFLVGFIGTQVAYFSMREVMQNRFVLQLGPIMTFFFNVLYLQYHMSRIANGEVQARS